MAKKKFTKEEIAVFIEEFNSNLDNEDKDEFYGTMKDGFEEFKDSLIDFIKTK